MDIIHYFNNVTGSTSLFPPSLILWSLLPSFPSHSLPLSFLFSGPFKPAYFALISPSQLPFLLVIHVWANFKYLCIPTCVCVLFFFVLSLPPFYFSFQLYFLSSILPFLLSSSPFPPTSPCLSLLPSSPRTLHTSLEIDGQIEGREMGRLSGREELGVRVKGGKGGKEWKVM